MKKATIYDYSRLCKAQNGRNGKCPICEKCPLGAGSETNNYPCYYLLQRFPDKANEIILKWCEEHPVKTRQSEFLKMFPNVIRFENNNIIAIKPCDVDKDYAIFPCALTCEECFKEYWLAEVEE